MAPRVAAGMKIWTSGAEKATTEVQGSQSEPHADSQPSPSQSSAPTYADFSRYLNEVQQVQAGTLSSTEFNRRRASEVASIQRSSSVGRSPSAVAQLSPPLAPPVAVLPAAASPTVPSPSLLPLRQVQPVLSDSPASATLSITPVTPAAPAVPTDPAASALPASPVAPAAPATLDKLLSAGRPVRQAALIAAANLALVSPTLFIFYDLQ